MLSPKLLSFYRRNTAGKRAAQTILRNFSYVASSSLTNNKGLWNSISLCPSRSFSKEHSECAGHQGNRESRQLIMQNVHSLQHHKSNFGFVSPFNVLSSRTMAVPFRQLHTSMLITAHVGPMSHKSITTPKRFKETAMGLMTHQQTLASLSPKENNNDFNGRRTMASGSDRTNAEIPISPEALKDGLHTRESVTNFLAHLSEDQKSLLYHSLNIDVLRNQYEGHLGSSKSESHQYLSRFGRPTADLGTEDPTGTLCEVPPKWLHTRLDEKSHPPSPGAIWAVGLKNALPFIGFGFLDNLIMILAGDYIDITIGTTLGISTMAAAALGNTISDVAGIGSAWYVEDFANKIGIKDPELTPSQFASWTIRWASNGGRAIGVVIGCLLGMVPLLFFPSPEEKEEKEKAAEARKKSAADKKDKS